MTFSREHLFALIFAFINASTSTEALWTQPWLINLGGIFFGILCGLRFLAWFCEKGNAHYFVAFFLGALVATSVGDIAAGIMNAAYLNFPDRFSTLSLAFVFAAFAAWLLNFAQMWQRVVIALHGKPRK